MIKKHNVLTLTLMFCYHMGYAETLPPAKEEFEPFDLTGVSVIDTHQRSSRSTVNPTVSCLDYINYQRYQSGKQPLDKSEIVKKTARRQTRGELIGGLAINAAAGTAAGIATGNPVIGAGVFGVMELTHAIGVSVDRKKIKRNGNLMTAAEKKLMLGGDASLTKKEARAFERARKKVSKKTYGNKYALSDADFADTVYEQSIIAESPQGPLNGENLFCDIDRKGRVSIKPQDKQTIKRLTLAQKCKDQSRVVSSTREIKPTSIR